MNLLVMVIYYFSINLHAYFSLGEKASIQLRTTQTKHFTQTLLHFVKGVLLYDIIRDRNFLFLSARL